MQDDNQGNGAHGADRRPALALAEAANPQRLAPASGPRPRMLGQDDRREQARRLVAAQFDVSVLLSGLSRRAVAAQLKVHHSTVDKLCSGEQALSLADVLVVVPSISVPLLGWATSRVAGARPRWSGSPQTLIAAMGASIHRMASVLDQADLDKLTREQLEELQKANRQNQDRAAQLDREIEAALEKKRREEGGDRG